MYRVPRLPLPAHKLDRHFARAEEGAFLFAHHAARLYANRVGLGEKCCLNVAAPPLTFVVRFDLMNNISPRQAATWLALKRQQCQFASDANDATSDPEVKAVGTDFLVASPENASASPEIRGESVREDQDWIQARLSGLADCEETATSSPHLDRSASAADMQDLPDGGSSNLHPKWY